MTDRPQNVEDVRKEIKDRGIEFLFAQFVDMWGKPSAKLVPASHLDDFFNEGAGFAGFAAGEIGQGPHSPDMAAMPDPTSFTPVPWQPNLARFACDIYVEGEPWPYCPRTILRRQLERARKLGFIMKIGMEAEFFLLRDNNGKLELADPLDTLDRPCYDMKGLTRQYDFVTTLSRYQSEMGWDNYANDHEDANCQFESNFRYNDALTTADRIVFFRYMVHTLAQQRGMLATFMPKPFSHLTGNGCHMHTSLWDAETDAELFINLDDPRGLGASELAYHFLGGMLQHATAYIAVTAPTVNSYKRLKVGAPRSGATWSPVFVTYGGNNRTQMVRTPAPGRFEDRTVDGSCNPYLAATVVLASGLDGVENKIDPGEPNRDNLYEVPAEEIARRGIRLLPSNLLDAIRNLVTDDVLRKALGTTDRGDYIDYFASVKEAEWNEYHEQVTDWETRRYLGLF
ncbi:MAG TPA: type III glutamate--ammonia ligase [Acidimicrobiia bacterium]|nr:type III glutamate--ammonia ligase [Acidimicrobiia bacterium]